MWCRVKGYPMPETSWTFNGRQVNSEADSNIVVTDTGDLMIKRVTFDEEVRVF